MAKLGIDLGTANSAVAVFLEGAAISGTNPGVVQPVDGTSDGAYIIPSYIAFDNDGNVSAVGLRAKERYQRADSQNVLRNLKRLIGRPYKYVLDCATRGERSFVEFRDRLHHGGAGKVELQIAGRTIPVEEAVAYLLEKIVAEAQAVAESSGEPISAITISLPAGFDDLQREATFQAARKAGLENVHVIEEPTAAALARGLDGCTGNVMVIDIGAGTTDIVVGPMSMDSQGNPYLCNAARTCDDELGGIDMDFLILEYLLKQDAGTPRLSDVYAALPSTEKGKLMGAIESGKISASLSGIGAVATALRVGTKAKQLNMTLSEDLLNQIVGPILKGRRAGDMIKGVKPLVEKTLLEVALVNTERLTRALRDRRHQSVTSYLDANLLRAAGFDPEEVKAALRQAINEIEHVVLVGGPCRMRSVHRLLGEVFAENAKVCEQLATIDPLDSFFMEAVARGATMSRGTMQATVPYNISVFTWEKGVRTVIIPKGTPYFRNEPLVRFGTFKAEGGGQMFHVLSEKDGPRAKWPYRQYVLNVPRPGSVKVTLGWKEEGIESKRATVEGQEAGILGRVQFPPLEDTATLGEHVKSAFLGVLTVAKNLRSELPEARRRAEAEAPAEIRKQAPFLPAEVIPKLVADWIRDNIDLPETDLHRCDAIDPETMSEPTEEELERVTAEGFHSVCFDIALRRWGLSDRALKLLKYVLSRPPLTDVEQLIPLWELVLAVGQGELGPSDRDTQQLEECMERLRSNPHDSGRGAQAATVAGILAERLHSERPQIFPEEIYGTVMYVARAFRAS